MSRAENPPIRTWRVVVATVAFLLVGPSSLNAQGSAAGDEVFASSGRQCGYPGRRVDMSRVVEAARGYPNSRILILTPQEKARVEWEQAQWNRGGGRPLRQMAPCFTCSPEYEACIVFERGEGDVFASGGAARPPGDSFGSGGGSSPPDRTTSEACRNSPQSYSCLYGHPEVATGPAPIPPPAAPPPGTDCVEPTRADTKTSSAGRDAASPGYDPNKINVDWERRWKPKWDRAMNALNGPIGESIKQMVLEVDNHQQAGTGTPGASHYIRTVAAAWHYKLAIARNGSVTAVTLLQRPGSGTLMPSDPYARKLFTERASRFAAVLSRLKGPAFPTGSRWGQIYRYVQFDAVHSGDLADPTAPREPELGLNGEVLSGQETKGKLLEEKPLKAKAGKLCD